MRPAQRMYRSVAYTSVEQFTEPGSAGLVQTFPDFPSPTEATEFDLEIVEDPAADADAAPTPFGYLNAAFEDEDEESERAASDGVDVLPRPLEVVRAGVDLNGSFDDSSSESSEGPQPTSPPSSIGVVVTPAADAELVSVRETQIFHQHVLLETLSGQLPVAELPCVELVASRPLTPEESNGVATPPPVVAETQAGSEGIPLVSDVIVPHSDPSVAKEDAPLAEEEDALSMDIVATENVVVEPMSSDVSVPDSEPAIDTQTANEQAPLAGQETEQPMEIVPTDDVIVEPHVSRDPSTEPDVEPLMAEGHLSLAGQDSTQPIEIAGSDDVTMAEVSKDVVDVGLPTLADEQLTDRETREDPATPTHDVTVEQGSSDDADVGSGVAGEAKPAVTESISTAIRAPPPPAAESDDSSDVSASADRRRSRKISRDEATQTDLCGILGHVHAPPPPPTPPTPPPPAAAAAAASDAPPPPCAAAVIKVEVPLQVDDDGNDAEKDEAGDADREPEAPTPPPPPRRGVDLAASEHGAQSR